MLSFVLFFVSSCLGVFFFFQAEDGIRDADVTGVQCALPISELFGVSVLGRLLGVVLTADGVAEAVSPMAIGYLRDVTGSYDMGFVALIVIALVGAAAVA